jgi:hypothetical protein
VKCKFRNEKENISEKEPIKNTKKEKYKEKERENLTWKLVIRFVEF